MEELGQTREACIRSLFIIWRCSSTPKGMRLRAASRGRRTCSKGGWGAGQPGAGVGSNHHPAARAPRPEPAADPATGRGEPAATARADRRPRAGPAAPLPPAARNTSRNVSAPGSLDINLALYRGLHEPAANT